MLNSGRLLILCAFLASSGAQALCGFRTSAGIDAPENNDPLYQILMRSPECPKNVQELRAILQADGLQLNPHMVGNRGFHNPQEGSFSFFERVTGRSQMLKQKLGPSDFFFGHFTEATEDSKLALAQSEGLMIELVVWDFKKQAYNFYELIGDGARRTWFYRGDSFDIFEDNKLLHLQADPTQPVFGQRLRCSGCHASGGPIMKELAEPHNDWWRRDRPLPFGSLIPDQEIKDILANVQDASKLSAAVRQGIERLEKSPTIRAVKNGRTTLPSGRTYSWREALRPLFATLEINLESDLTPNAEKSTEPFVQIPSASLIDPRLAKQDVWASRALYRRALEQKGVVFPEGGLKDADHAWLVPVKSYSDQLAIKTLMKEGRISERFVLAVLSVEPDEILFSAQRLKLLRAVPESGRKGWLKEFLANLESMKTSVDPIEREAARSFLRNYALKPRELRHRAEKHLFELGLRFKQVDGLNDFVDRLIRQRRSVFENEISKNPRGQILEPGFRVIFPEKRQAPKGAPCEKRVSR